jgi:DNA-binding transcriptional regulator YbjK
LTPDGRRARGEVRRQALIAATLRVLERDGAAGVSHRAVAAEAGVPTASVGYHFDGIDDLLVSALVQSTEEWAARLAATSTGSPVGDLAQALTEDAREHKGLIVAEYELYLLAVRRPALRPAATAWLDAALGAAGEGLDDVGRRTMVAVLDGICLGSLVQDAPPDAATVRAVLERALAGARSGPGAPGG